MTAPPHLQRIVTAFGGQNAMARALGVRQGTVWSWLRTGHVPSRRIPAIIEAGRLLPKPVTLAPDDFFPRSSSEAA